MADFSARVTGLSGTVTDATELGTWLTDGACDVIRRLALSQPETLIRCAATAAVGTGGATLGTSAFILDVYRGTWSCAEIPADKRFEFNDSASLFKCTTRHPVYYRLNNRITILPTPTASNAFVSIVAPPTVASTDSVISTFPNDIEYLVIIYAACQNLQGKMTDLVLPSDVVLPVVPTLDSFVSLTQTLPVYSAVSAFTAPSIPADANIDFSGIGSTPTFTAPNAIVLPTLSLGADLSLSAFSQATTAPTPPVITLSDGSVAAFSTAPSFIAPTLTFTSMSTLAALTLPACVIPTAPTITDADFDSIAQPVPPADPSFTTPSITLPTAPTFTTPVLSLTDMAVLSSLTLPVCALPASPTITDIDFTSVATAPTAPPEPAFSIPSITLPASPVFVPPVSLLNLTTALATVTTQIETSEDLELAQGKLVQIGQAVNVLGTDIQNATNSFNASNTEFQAKVQEVVRECELLQTKEAQEYQAKISRYQAQVQAYATLVNSEVQKWNLNQTSKLIEVWRITVETAIAEYQAKVSATVQAWNLEQIQGAQGKWIAARQSELAKYNGDLQSALQDFNASNVEYQAGVQEVIRECELLQTKEANEYSAKLQRYQTETQVYATLINAEVQKFSLNQSQKQIEIWRTNVQATMEEYQTKINATIQAWNMEQIQGAQGKWIAARQTEIAEYSGKLQSALQDFNASNVEFQSDIQHKIQEATNLLESDRAKLQSELQKYAQELQQYQVDVNNEFQEYLQVDVAAEVTEWTTKRANLLEEFGRNSGNVLQKHAQELQQQVQSYTTSYQSWVQLIQKAVSTYQAETGYDLSKFSAELQEQSTRHTADLQNEQQEFASGIQKYQADLQYVTSTNQDYLNKYAQKIGAYGAEANNTIQQFNAILNKRNMNYQWYVDQYNRLKGQYEQGFITRGKQNG